MICPHCHQTIREEQRYLMSADPDAELPAWARSAAGLLILFVAAVLAFYAISQAVGS